MKYFTTQKAIRNRLTPIVKIGYCNAQTLLRYENPFAYNSGVYGWNCDYYHGHNIIICTGYRPHGYSNPKINNIIREYEKHAQSIDNDISLSYEKRRDYILTLLDKCMYLVLEEMKKW